MRRRWLEADVVDDRPDDRDFLPGGADIVQCLRDELAGHAVVELLGPDDRGGIAFADGGYDSKRARAVRGAWFRDSEGNMLGLLQFVP